MNIRLRQKPFKFAKIEVTTNGQFKWVCSAKDCDRVSPIFSSLEEAEKAKKYHETLENLAFNNYHLQRKMFDGEYSYPKADSDTVIISSRIQRDPNFRRIGDYSIYCQSA